MKVIKPEGQPAGEHKAFLDTLAEIIARECTFTLQGKIGVSNEGGDQREEMLSLPPSKLGRANKGTFHRIPGKPGPQVH